MHMSFKKGLVIAMTAGLLGTNGLHAKASDSLEQAETAVCQTENITFPTTNDVLRTSGLFTPVQNTEEEDTSIIVEERDMSEAVHPMTVTGQESFIRGMSLHWRARWENGQQSVLVM